MIEYIFLFIFLFSIVGIIFIVFSKIPILLLLPKEEKISFRLGFVSIYLNQVKEWAKKTIPLVFYKILFYFKIIILKIEVLLDALLQRIRKKFSQKKEK